MSGEWSVARVLTLLLVFVVVAPAVGGLAVCVELVPGSGQSGNGVEREPVGHASGAAAGARDDDDTSCTGLITERLHALGLGFNTVSSCCRWSRCMG